MFLRSARSIALATLAACGSTSTSPTAAAPAVTPAPADAAPVSPAITGPHVASERVYQGECAPPGSRGGCYRITLRPDGTYQKFMLDMAMEGTYTIEGQTVSLTASDPAMNEQLVLSADGTLLGDYTLVR